MTPRLPRKLKKALRASKMTTRWRERIRRVIRATKGNPDMVWLANRYWGRTR